MAFATNEDLADLVPSIFTHGIEDFTVELARAEADVLRKIQVEWFNRARARSNWDATRLTDSQWTAATVYRALAHYILPQLSQWRPGGDAFREQTAFYSELFAEEMRDQFAIGIEYDLDDSGDVSSNENAVIGSGRLWR